jgi:hypothetical protein
MPEFEPINSDERDLGAGLETELPGVPGRRWPWQVGLVGLLLAAGVLVILQRSPEPAADTDEPHPTPSVTTVAPPVRTPPPLPTVPSPTRLVEHPVTLNLPGDVTDFDVAPDGYAAVLATACTTLSDCNSALATSADGGRWVQRKLPRGIGHGPTVWSLGDGVLVVEQATDQPPDLRRWRSGDGGRTWREVSAEPAEPVPDATGGTLIVTTEEYQPVCGGHRLAVLGRDGRMAPLRRPPEGIAPCYALAYPDPAGRLWVAGIEPSTRQAAIAVSYDGGYSWRTSLLHGSHLDAEFVWLSLAGTDLYATVFGPLHESPERFGVLAVFWYDFATWDRIARYEGPSRELNGMIACPRGMLLAVQQQLKPFDREHQMVSYDRGRSWALADTRMVVSTRPSASPYADHAYYGWWYAPSGSQGVVRSTDCRTWHTLGVR